MFPTICQIGPLTIHSYGLMLALSVVICAICLGRDAGKLGIKPESIYDFTFWVVISGLLGARMLYVLLNFDHYLKNPKEIMMLHEGGLAWQGGFLLGALVGILYVRWKKWDLILFLDLVSPYIALGQAIGRLGCFLNGCCYGLPYTYGVYFPVHGQRLHPTQLYEAAGLFFIFISLKQLRKTQHVNGQIFVVYLLAASLLRFWVEYYRGDHEIVWHDFSPFQLSCVVIFIAGLIFNAVIVGKAKKKSL